jgi:hypothetical protein
VSDYVDPPDPDLDDIPRRELGEIDPMHPVVADCLTSWLGHQLIERASDHGVGTFLDELAAAGYRVTPIEVPDIHLPPPTE